MYFIFVSSKTNDLSPIKSMNKENINWALPPNEAIKSEYHHKINCNRIVDCYSFDDNIDKNITMINNDIYLWHGYLLDADVSTNVANLRPEKNYYGVYSHACITNENCWFATDEIGLSPLYYSNKGGISMVSNNPNLIAVYKKKLGFKINVEPTLAIWHTIGITNESYHTGYKDIYRVEPWRYIFTDIDNNINFPSKERKAKSASYDDLCYESIQELRKGMFTINRMFTKKFSQLTGGFDSRLTLTYIMDEGHKDDWNFITNGGEQNPDCLIAEMLAKKFNLNHERRQRRQFKQDEKDVDAFIKEVCLANAMESSLVRIQSFMGTHSEEVCLNGMGAVFAKSLGFADTFMHYMQRKFRGERIDWDKLTQEQYSFGHDCFGFADADRFFLKEDGLNVVKEFRKYLFEFNYNRFPDNLNYADSMSAYRWRTHNSNLSTIENNIIFLYSPTVLEASRKLNYNLRKEGKLYFDMMWKLNPEMCFIPYENRVYSPLLYDEFPDKIKSIFLNIPSVTGSIASETQITFFDTILPTMRNELLDMLPEEIFLYINKQSVEKRLKECHGFGKQVFCLIGLYGIAKWYEIIDELNTIV